VAEAALPPGDRWRCHAHGIRQLVDGQPRRSTKRPCDFRLWQHRLASSCYQGSKFQKVGGHIGILAATTSPEQDLTRLQVNFQQYRWTIETSATKRYAGASCVNRGRAQAPSSELEQGVASRLDANAGLCPTRSAITGM
jgi:hypothetical protein